MSTDEHLTLTRLVSRRPAAGVTVVKDPESQASRSLRGL